MTKVETIGGKASVEQGKVILDGPDGVAVTMTTKAAKQTGKNLCHAAEVVEQRRDQDVPVVGAKDE